VRLAHLADLHVGYRQFPVRASNGANQREFDVEASVRAALTDVIGRRPDVVLLAGDIFHSVVPPPRAILFLFGELQRLRAALPAARIVMVSGDHDTPRSTESTSILGLYRALGADVVQAGVERVAIGDHLVVTCVPKPWARQAASLEPLAGATNVLLVHGEARAFKGREIEDGALAKPWDYVALGHWHVCQQVGPRAWYAGALDYVSTDPWGELREQAERGVHGKGWLELELPGGVPAFRPVPASRPFLDLGALDMAERSVEQIDAAIAEVVAQAPDGAVARLVVAGVSRVTKHALDHARIAAAKARLLNLKLVFEPPLAEATTPAARGDRLKRLDVLLDEFLGARTLPEDVDRDELRRLGQEYLQPGKAEAEDIEQHVLPQLEEQVPLRLEAASDD